MADEFQDRLIATLPKMRIWALSLTHNRPDADDLIQDAAVNMLAARASFTPGSNFEAWAYYVLRNRFITIYRQRRRMVYTDALAEDAASVNPAHEDRLVLKELRQAFYKLQPLQREALMLSVFWGIPYAELAEMTGCSVGTVKSRVSRARSSLQGWMLGERRRVARTRVQPRPAVSVQAEGAGPL